ncbi:hypothetical protein KEH51_25995 [[Brevibacterium] frigoritolerans]|uniref:Uncharacterized protein n=1 Tax=Peribacillus frigoritolerans TaxID=450367 RepID=A0A941JBU4_9BACI|nr:hypothetical protein [Peribacillus frigoritolerans]
MSYTTKGENAEIEEKINADKFPVVALLNSNGVYSGVKFHGVPGGHELNSFILAIYNLAGPGQALDSAVLNSIKGISKKRTLRSWFHCHVTTVQTLLWVHSA